MWNGQLIWQSECTQISRVMSSAINVSAKQKLNMESSTVAESVGADCAPPLALWVPPFLKEQGHKVEEDIVKQDNKSTALLAKMARQAWDRECKQLTSGIFT